MIIGITGPAGAGKGEVVNYLMKKGFLHFSFREYIIGEIKKRGMPVNRDSMILVANDMRKNHGSDYIALELIKKAEKTKKNCILESVRTVGEVEALKNSGDFKLLAVNADIEIRYDRIKKRGSETDNVTFEKFKEQEETEMHSDDKTKQNVAKCVEIADMTLTNNGTFEELHSQIDKILLDIQ
ncbi:AAA family ATPase [Candidatus Woesearchaeota archaeon]|nr:AAA family ATPase [Candidatus Woesearchaeota archaeon]